jgi:hypothetical protein
MAVLASAANASHPAQKNVRTQIGNLKSMHGTMLESIDTKSWKHSSPKHIPLNSENFILSAQHTTIKL